MAAASKVLTLLNKTVAFAIVTGKGRKGKKEENEYVMAVECSPKEKKAIIDFVEEFFGANKSNTKAKMKQSPEDWFTPSKSDPKNFVFWASEVISSGITYKVATGTGYDMKSFAALGSGSVVDAEYRMFHYNNSFGEGVGLRLAAIKLNTFVAYTGAGGASLEGDTLQADGTQVEGEAAKDDEWAELVAEFNEAIEDRDWEEADECLADLKDHDDHKAFKKQLKKAKRK